MLFRYIILSLVLLSLTFGCKINTNNDGDFAYVGGEIINPKNNSVVLYNTKGKVVEEASRMTGFDR